jgi:hyperosmotically inducible periplasmic protein
MNRFECLLAVLLAAIAVAGCTPQQQRSTQTAASRDARAAGVQLSDGALEVKVGAAIASEAGTNVFHITPVARHGVVTLTGTVPSQAIHETVLRTVRAVPGVKTVVDRITVE